MKDFSWCEILIFITALTILFKILKGRYIERYKENKMKNNPYRVKVGQIWLDYDCRYRNYPPVYKEIVKIEEDYAYVEGFKADNPHRVISKSRINLKRFKPNSTGYKLIKE